jgi:hypothetical protein
MTLHFILLHFITTYKQHHSFSDKLFVILDHSTVFKVTYTRGCIDTIDSPDDEHLVARNM